jgi:hypothetical protein
MRFSRRQGLGALFEFGGFVVAAKFAEGLGLGGQVADETKASPRAWISNATFSGRMSPSTSAKSSVLLSE